MNAARNLRLVVDSEAVGADWESIRHRARLELETSIGRELSGEELDEIRALGEDTTRVEAEAKLILEAYERLRRSPSRGAVELVEALAPVVDLHTEQIVGVAPEKNSLVRGWASLWEPNPGPMGVTVRVLEHFDRPHFLGMGAPPQARWATLRELALLLLVTVRAREIEGSGDRGADFASAYAAALGTVKKTRQRGHGRSRWERVAWAINMKLEQVAVASIARDERALEQVEQWIETLVSRGDSAAEEWELVALLLVRERHALERSLRWHREALTNARVELSKRARRRGGVEREGDTSTLSVSPAAAPHEKAASVHDLDAEADDHRRGPPLAGGGDRPSHRARVAGR